MPEAESITVLVADDHPVFREAVGRAITSRAGLELVGLAGDGDEALEAIRTTEPSIAVIDQQLPSRSGLDILRAVQQAGLPTRVIMLSGDGSATLVYEAVQLGAAGFLTKAATLDSIREAIVAVAAGHTVLAPEVQDGLVAELRKRAQQEGPILTERETEILHLIADGLSTPQIGARLFISPSTVKTHVKSLYEKLAVGDRAAAVA